MGCNFSRNATSLVCRNVRVVQLNGEVDDFDYPVSVSELTAKLPKHFVYTNSQLLSPCSKPLMPNTFLEPGQIYFLLPISFFQSNFSPTDLVTVARKLNNVARSNRSKVNANLSTSSPVWRSPASCPNRFPELPSRVEQEHVMMQKSCKSRSWKPILATIRERSFNRRSESDLQEKGMVSLETKSNLQGSRILARF